MATIFDHENLLQYFDLIQLPEKFRNYREIPKDGELLTALHIHQLATFPYENLEMHYSKTHFVDINPQKVWEKYQAGRGRGGHCMENNIVFLHVLRAVGFSAYSTGARIRLRHGIIPDGPYVGLSHICTIVTVENGDKWHVDVSFSGDGPTVPMILISGHTILNLGTQEIRLVRSTIDQFETQDEFWIYEYRNKPDAPWNHYYCFYEIPFIQADFEVISYSETTQGFLPSNVVIVRFLRIGEKIGGKVMLVNGTVKRNMGGRTEIVHECYTEEGRIEALMEYFGMTLTNEEKKGILGTPTELKGDERGSSLEQVLKQ